MNDVEDIDYFINYINEESDIESNVESIKNAGYPENIDTDSFSRDRGFNVVKDRVSRENDVIRRRAYICKHGRHYDSSSNKETGTKKILCQWHVNASCSKHKNPDSLIFINKIVNEHNHELNIDAIKFEQTKKFSKEMMDDIEFLTKQCRMSATAQKRYLEDKYPSKPIYSKDLYAAISKFRPTGKSLLNDAARISNWLD
ncbi:24969_t:CDS:2, partial [Gigaspora rosea]